MRILFFLLFCLVTSGLVHANCNDPLKDVSVDDICTRIMTYNSDIYSTQPALVVVLHGDSPFESPGYQYLFAKKLASMTENVVAVGLLRPGYSDPTNRTSAGNRGEAVGDNYDLERTAQIKQAIDALEERYQPRKVVLVGHSGGAAIAANIIGLYPGEIDHAFLVSCPCDVSQWRSDMFSLTQEAVFSGDISVLSPHMLANTVSDDTRVSLIVGSEDVVTRPYLSERYMELLKSYGVSVTMTIIQGEHNILLTTDVLTAVARAVKD